MLKKILKVATTFTLLLGCYLGYGRAFELVVRQFKTERLDDGLLFEIRNARSKQEARALAERAFGPGHWTGTDDLPYAYYNSQKRFWMYWRDYEEVKEENGVRYDGKRVRMRPFAMISKTGDGKSLWTLTAEEAILDLNQPIGISNKQGSEAIKVEHAVVERDVRIRDDRGTPLDPADDLNIGSMTYLEYDEAKHLITTTSHVVMQDPDQTTIGDGLEIKLRSPDPNVAVAQNSSSSGFGGAEYAILEKNVRVTMRDVGNSGVLPGGGAKPARKTGGGSTKVDLTVNTTGNDASAKNGKSATPDDPVPLYIQSDGLMRIDFPPDAVPVAVGPPTPPAPTLARFERKVVALHGHLDREPNQLDCDTLRLTLIPAAAEPPARKGKVGSGERKDEVVLVDTGAARSSAPSGEPNAGLDDRKGGAKESTPTEAAGGPPKGGLLGNLTLQKAHATGHVVWLQLRQQSAKVRCGEMIHERSMPYRPDSTFFRGDSTRKVWLEKIDYEPEEGSEPVAVASAARATSAEQPPKLPRKVKSVTHVVTISAKLFDKGNGLELVDVRAFGPGRLESRPDIGQPVERIADWQDELTIVNLVGTDGKLLQKRVTLTGIRPFFVDLPKKASLDSAQEIRVFLKPRTLIPAETGSVAEAQGGVNAPNATHIAARPPTVDASATGAGSQPPSGAGGTEDGATAGLGESLQIERILAYRDVHFKAPNRYMEARTWLDAPFIEIDPVPADPPSTETKAEGSPAAVAASPPAPGSGEVTTPGAGTPTSPPLEAVAATESAGVAPAEPAMTAVADRIWAKVAIPRGQSLDPSKEKSRKKPRNKILDPNPAITAADAADTASAPVAEMKDAEADVREAWLRGNVAVHQDKSPDPAKKGQARPKGDDITGEAVYLDNKGKGKMNARVYHRDPTDSTPIPGPIRWAKVSTDDMITFGQVLWMDQENDKVWANGPGTLLQWTDRAMMTDKTPEPQAPADETGDTPATGRAARKPAAVAKATTPPRPKTRAGVPVSDKDLITITWTKRMEFTGRTTDTSGRPAARADFFGIVDANMTDAKLHCMQKMIVFTDREVRLAELGGAKGGPAARATGDAEVPELPEGDENSGREAPEKSRVDIAMIYCFGQPTAISRKVDPDVKMVNELQRIDAWDYNKPTGQERLDYNRRTGQFFVPGPGTVYLYDREEDTAQAGANAGAAGEATGPGAAGARPATASRSATRPGPSRTVTPTSARSPNRPERAPAAAGRAAGGPQQGALNNAPVVSRKILPLILMQVKFSNGMKGRVGAGQASDTRQERSSEFFGNIEFLRSEVAHEAVVLNPDQRLSEDGFYLTSQMLRIIQEPPRPGSPANTPAHSFAKAWEQVHVNRGEAFAIESDVATFDSGSELLWAYGENGHGVSLAHQSGPGQPTSSSRARAVQYNVKTHAWREVEGSNLIMIDHRTGARPVPMPTPDPTAPPPPKIKTPFKVPNTNLERRGFTGY